MITTILATKLYIPPPRSKTVLRPRLIERLNEGLSSSHKLTLISAPAGFGKTTLISEWGTVCDRPVAWLSLDEGDNDSTRFMTYLIAALQTIMTNIGAGVLGVLQSPQPPSTESTLTALLNEIATIPDPFILVLDDYHMIDAKSVNDALTFLLEHLPQQMHLVITTREDPQLPLARLRARGHLTELRAADLRFAPAESTEFLNQVMGLSLTTEDIAALEARTEGWITGLQLASISMQGQPDTSGFIKSFTGSHHFILDYLIEEVLQQQSESIHTFLLCTSILDRMCGPLCDAVLGSPSASSQETLEYLERTNLFIIPLDTERRWFRYHHLFADLLRQRLLQSVSSRNEEQIVTEYHIRASRWFENHGLDIEAFKYAVAANDVESAERLMTGKRMPMHFGGVMTTIMSWLASLPATVLDARPQLRVHAALLSLATGQSTGVEEKLQAAEAALYAFLQGAEPDTKTRDLIGQIAAARATLALTRYQPEAMIIQAHRALEYLHPDSLPARIRAIWTMGFAYQVQGDRAAARQAYTEALAISRVTGNIRFIIVTSISLGVIQEFDNNLYQAAETFRGALQLAGDYPQPFEGEGHLGLARILYEWNDLDGAERHGQLALKLARQFDKVIDRYIICEVFLASLKLARGDVAAAAAMLAETEQSVRQHDFKHRIAEVAAAQVLVFIRQGDLDAAAHLAQTHDLSIRQSRVHLALGDATSALAVLEPLRRQMESKGWQDERLKVMVLQAVAYHAHGDLDKALQILGDALVLAEPGGFIRLFVDEGQPMACLLTEAAIHGMTTDYVRKLLATFEAEGQQVIAGPAVIFGKIEDKYRLPISPVQPLIEPLSQRELKILHLIAQGLSNREISERLFLAVSTIKGHNRNIFDKLQVQSRTESVARARELGLL